MANNSIAFACNRCKEVGVIDKDTNIENIQVKLIGYDGEVEFYMICSKCGCKTRVPEEIIPKKLRRKLLRKILL